jgi:predicted permease
MIGSVMQDVRYGLRQLRRSPGFAATVVGVLALGIGANAAMFTVLDGTLLRHLPYRFPGELVTLSAKNDKGDPVQQHLADIVQWQQRSRTTDGIGYYSSMQAYVANDAGEQMVSSVSVSPNLFGVLGVSPAQGRGFTTDEQQEGKSNVVVLSDALWRGRFHAADVLGKVVKIDDVPVTVVGVMPARFVFPADDKEVQVWRPIKTTAESMGLDFKGDSYSSSVARLRGGASVAAVQEELSRIDRQMRPLYAATMTPAMTGMLAPSEVVAIDYRRSLVEEQRTALLALLAAVAVVWLIACANVANLMLARSSARRKEMAVRGALGAGRWRLVRQLMVESLLLSVSGALLGIGLAEGTLKIFHHALTTQLSPALATSPNAGVLAALLGLSVVSALLFGVAPTLLAARIPLDRALRQNGMQAGSGRSQQRLQRILVVAEIGLSLTLLVACGLLLRTVFALRHVPLGFRTDHVYVVTPELPRYKYRVLDANQTVYKPLLARVQQMHGVEAAAITTVVPLDKGFSMTMRFYVVDGTAKDKITNQITSTMKATGPELQQVLGFKMAQGRYFNAQDTPDEPLVAVVNRAFAKLYEQNGSSISNFSLSMGAKGRSFKIVGVIDDFHQVGITDPVEPEIDLNAAQLRPTDGFYKGTLNAYVELAIRTSREEQSFLPDLQRVMREVNPDLSASTVKTMDEVVDDAMGSQLLAAHLLEALGVLALLVALAGLYSLLAYLVTLRTRELGLRMALGAERGHILGLVMRQAGWMLASGIVLGVGMSVAATQLLKHFLFGVEARDAATIAAAAFLMMMVGAVAAYLPARRASQIEPMEVIRTE